MGFLCMRFIFDVTGPTIYESYKFMFTKSNVKCMFDCVIAMIYICSGNPHMDENMDIDTFYIDNQCIKCIYLNPASLFALMLTAFMTILQFLIRLNDHESLAGWIVNDNWHNYYQSYYKRIYCYSSIFIALAMITLWLKMTRLIMFESILFADEYLHISNDENNFNVGRNETDLTIDKTMDLYDDCAFINSNLMHFIGGIYSTYIIYQLIYYLYISQKFIIDQLFIIMIVLVAYALILNHIYIQQQCDVNHTINLTVSTVFPIAWFLIVIMEFKLVLLMVVVSTTLYHAIRINSDDDRENQDSNTAVRGKILCLVD